MVHPRGMATADSVKSMAHDGRVGSTTVSFQTALARPNGSIFESKIVMTLLKGLDGVAFQKIFMLDTRSFKELGFPIFYEPSKSKEEEVESDDIWSFLQPSSSSSSSPLSPAPITELDSSENNALALTPPISTSPQHYTPNQFHVPPTPAPLNSYVAPLYQQHLQHQRHQQQHQQQQQQQQQLQYYQAPQQPAQPQLQYHAQVFGKIPF